MGRKSLPTDEFNLTERERRMLDFMKQTALEKGYPPTVREICEKLGVKSTSTVHKDLASLEKKGFIRKDPAKPRAIEIVGLGDTTARGTVAEPASAPVVEERTDVIDIPLIGQVAAGTPILAEENMIDSFPIPARYVNGGADHFMLTVKGESMIEAGILDGDLVIAEKTCYAENGEIVVALVEDEATVKTFFREDGHYRLQPENETMEPIIVEEVDIIGKVVAIQRSYV